jgi:membrane-associated phospholipid phosphatase
MADLELENDPSLTPVTGSPPTESTIGSDLRQRWPLTWRDVGVLAAASVAIAAVLVGIGKLITGPLDGSVGDIDRRVARWFADGRTSGLDDLSYWGSMLSETAVKVVVTAVVAAVMIAVWKRWNDALLVAVALILEACVFLSVTLLVGRHRPDVTQLDSSPVDSSFPSGHAAAAVVYGSFAIIVARHTTRRWPVALAVAVATAVSFIVAWARMYRGMHHLSDVLGGVVLGLVSIWVTWRVMARADERGRHGGTDAHGFVEERPVAVRSLQR